MPDGLGGWDWTTANEIDSRADTFESSRMIDALMRRIEAVVADSAQEDIPSATDQPAGSVDGMPRPRRDRVVGVGDSLSELESELREFAAARDWGRFHTPRNLAMALSGEVGELTAVMQWLTDEEVQEQLRHHRPLEQQLADEMADVLIYLVRLADVTGVDLLRAAREKIVRNEIRYPRDVVRGRAVKYTEVGEAASGREE